MPHVVAIGSYPSEFLTHLEAAGYTYTTGRTYAEVCHSKIFQVKSTNSNSSLQVKFEYRRRTCGRGCLWQRPWTGVHAGNTVASGNERNPFAFSPSLTLLQIVKSAIGTVIDLPEVKLEDDVPLIVFKMRNINRFHIVPGFTISKSEQQSTESRPSIFIELSVKLIEKCITHASGPILLHRQTHIDTLTPPLGTVWWSTTLVSLVNWNMGSMLFLWWSVDVYTYATRHTPNPNKDFARNGGMVYTVMKHHGNFSQDKGSNTSFAFISGSTSIGNTGGLLYNDYQSPTAWSSVQDKSYFYDITFDKTVTLFKDAGNTAYEHALRYGHPYMLEKIKQTSSSPDGQTFKFEFKSSELLNGHEWISMPLHGVSVWRSDVGKTKMNCKCEFSGKLSFITLQLVNESKELPLDLTFGGA